jgi:hypothetical protein
MIVDAWMQHPTPRFLAQPWLATLKRWTRNAHDADLRLEATLGAMNLGEVDLAAACCSSSLSLDPRGSLVRRHSEARRKSLTKLLSRKQKAMRDCIQLSEAITGDGAAIFRDVCWINLEGIVSKRIGSRYVSGRTRAWLKTKNPKFQRG